MARLGWLRLRTTNADCQLAIAAVSFGETTTAGLL